MKEPYVMESLVKPVPWVGITPPQKQSTSLKISLPKDTEGFQSLEVYFNKI